MPAGRPTDYSAELATSICEKLAEGKSLRGICADESMPAESTVRKWAIEDREGFYAQYARARETQADVLAEEIVQISDEQAVCYSETGNAFDPDVNRDRLRIDARKWFASKVAPKKYGDKLELAGNPENPIYITDAQLANIANKNASDPAKT